MRVTGVVQREAWRARTLPPVEEVRPGLWSLPVPIPDNPLRYTLTYLVAGDDGLVVVDPGWSTEATWRALLDGLAAAGAAVAEVTGIVVTHTHPDHHGLSGRLRELSGAWVAMHPAERDALPVRRWAGGDARARDLAWLASCGVPADVAADLAVTEDRMRRLFAMVEPDVLLDDGDTVPLGGRRLRAVWTPGHSPGHLCLHEETENVLLTGDHVLPRITPNIGLWPRGGASPLADYLWSLDRVVGYDTAEALPAHEYRFRGLADRVRILHGHHERRCEEILAVVGGFGVASPWQVSTRLTWSRGWGALDGFMRRAAVAETAAHLEYLAGRRRVDEVRDGSGGPVCYRLPGSLEQDHKSRKKSGDLPSEAG